MLTLLVVGVLVAIAYPSFTDQVRKSRRADAISALMAVQQAQERWRANNTSYANFNTAAPAESANGLAMTNQSASGYYSLAISGLSATRYTVVATATDGRSQTSDANCRNIGVRAAGGDLRYGSGSGDIDWTAANPDIGKCWAR